MVAVTKKHISRKKSQRGGSKLLPPEAQPVKVNRIKPSQRSANYYVQTKENSNSLKNSAKSAAAFIPASAAAGIKATYELGKFGLHLPGVVAASPLVPYQGIKLLSKGREINKARGFSQSNVTKKLEEFQKKKTEWEELQRTNNIKKKDVGLIKQRTAEQKLILNLTEKINRQSGRKETNKRSLNENAGKEILKLLRTNDGQGGQGEFKTGDELQKAIADGYKALANTKIKAYEQRQENKVFKNTTELRSKKDKIKQIIANKEKYISVENQKIEKKQNIINKNTQTYMEGIKQIEEDSQYSTAGITDPKEIKQKFKDKNKAIEDYKNDPLTKKLVMEIQNLKNNILQSQYLIKREETLLNPYKKELSEVRNKIGLYIPKKFSNLEGSYNRRRERLNKTKTYYKNIFTNPFKKSFQTYKNVRDNLKKFEIAKAITPDFKSIGKDIVSGITPSIGTYKVTNIPNINIFDDTTKFNIFESRTSKYVKLAELYEENLLKDKKLSLDDRIKNKTQINKIYEYFNDKKDKYINTLITADKTNGISNISVYDALINNKIRKKNYKSKEEFQNELDTKKTDLTLKINDYTTEYKKTSAKTNAGKKQRQIIYKQQLQLINELRAITVLESFNKIKKIKRESDELVTSAITMSEIKPLLSQQT